MGKKPLSDDPRSRVIAGPGIEPSVGTRKDDTFPPLPPEYDPTKTVKKGLGAGATALIAALIGLFGTAIAGVLLDGSSIKAVLEEAHVPAMVQFVLVPLLVALGHMINNYRKNKDN